MELRKGGELMRSVYLCIFPHNRIFPHISAYVRIIFRIFVLFWKNFDRIFFGGSRKNMRSAYFPIFRTTVYVRPTVSDDI